MKKNKETMSKSFFVWRLILDNKEWKEEHRNKYTDTHEVSSDFALPSPSSLMDFGWETAKHCIVSYFWCASWLSWPSSSESGKGFTSIRQLKVWLFRLGGSPDQGPPFTERGKSRPRITKELTSDSPPPNCQNDANVLTTWEYSWDFQNNLYAS